MSGSENDPIVLSSDEEGEKQTHPLLKRRCIKKVFENHMSDIEEVEEEEEEEEVASTTTTTTTSRLKSIYGADVPSDWTDEKIQSLLDRIEAMEKQERKPTVDRDGTRLVLEAFTSHDTLLDFIALMSVWTSKHLLSEGLGSTRKIASDVTGLEVTLRVFSLLIEHLTSNAVNVLAMHTLKLCFRLSFNFSLLSIEDKFVLLSQLQILHNEEGHRCINIPFINMAVTLCREWMRYAFEEKSFTLE
jgi:hypothetical protein